MMEQTVPTMPTVTPIIAIFDNILNFIFISPRLIINHCSYDGDAPDESYTIPLAVCLAIVFIPFFGIEGFVI